MSQDRLDALIPALRAERAGYLDRGLEDRAAQVDAEIARLTGTAAPAIGRARGAQTRPRPRGETRKPSPPPPPPSDLGIPETRGGRQKNAEGK
jgi:hypothetical protein